MGGQASTSYIAESQGESSIEKSIPVGTGLPEAKPIGSELNEAGNHPSNLR